ncbi:hypothetical protein E7747_05555 [Duncaniella dubosii]|uniref:Uncharacterized protein n=1 Tax=Duncaniella dubosii TaxID=2518971 RepID=A0A4P7W1K9_9BACT|nr:hypothetical protein [Duncaniella dubosii]QCD41794.1 hypothetical protein E7747_05555 [Duncaniella dubosii]
MSAKGKQLNGYTITLNGRSVNTMEPYIELYEKDLQPGSEVEIVVQSNNYRPLKLKTPAEEMLVTEQLELVMQPVEQGVTLRLDFGDGRVFEQQISIEKNTPEYNRLHSGNFHGFRAHRQVTQDDSEVYNVDVRITSRPVAPNFESSDSDTGEKETKAPIFEKHIGRCKSRTTKIDATLPTAIDRKKMTSLPAGRQTPQTTIIVLPSRKVTKTMTTTRLKNRQANHAAICSSGADWLP